MMRRAPVPPAIVATSIKSGPTIRRWRRSGNLGRTPQGAIPSACGGDVAGEPPATKLPSRGAPPNPSRPIATRSETDGAARPPVTGAWRPGDPPGPAPVPAAGDRPPVRPRGRRPAARHHHRLRDLGRARPPGLQRRARLPRRDRRQPRRRPIGPGHPTPGWWEGWSARAWPLDTDRYFVVCVNVLGGCQGSTGPASIDPGDRRPYGSRFPVVTIRDMVRTQARLADHLGVDRVAQRDRRLDGRHAGARVGGHVPRPGARRSIPIATTAAGHRAADRLERRRAAAPCARPQAGAAATTTTPRPARAPTQGLALARMIAQITYRTDDVFTDRFGRELVDRERRRVRAVAALRGRALPRLPRRQARPPLRRQQLPAAVNKAMDLHDVGRGRGGLEAALARITVPTLAIGISSDTLYPTLPAAADPRRAAQPTARRRDYVEIDSPHGHDASCIEIDQVGAARRRRSSTTSRRRD